MKKREKQASNIIRGHNAEIKIGTNDQACCYSRFNSFNSLFAIHRIYKICTYLFFKVNNDEEVSFEALGLIRESDFFLC